MYKCSLERMSDKIKTFSKFGDAGHGGITRYSLSEAAHQARDEFVKRMTAIGAKIECDDCACLYATIEGSDPNAKRIVMGSHCDSVKNGGNYDGIEGVMTGMEVLETIVAENIPHKHPITAMIWTNEEGSLYPPAMMVSGIICYDYLPDYLKPNFMYDNMMASKPMDDSPYANFGEALAASKYKGDKANRISPDKYCAMFETHLEQGPILEDNGNEIGAVQLVMGMFNYRVRFHGFTAHAGTFPMELLPSFFQNISTFLPFTYVVEISREVLFASNINMSLVIKDLLILGLFALISLILAFTFSKQGIAVNESIEDALDGNYSDDYQAETYKKAVNE